MDLAKVKIRRSQAQIRTSQRQENPFLIHKPPVQHNTKILNEKAERGTPVPSLQPEPHKDKRR
jgi:hypothetical protein